MKQKHDEDPDDKLHEHSMPSFRDLKSEKGVATTTTATEAATLRHAPAVAADPGMREQEETLVDVVETMDSVKRRQKELRQVDAIDNPYMAADPGMRAQEETLVDVVETMDSVKRRQKELRQADTIDNPYVHAQQQRQTKQNNSTLVTTVANPDMLRLAPAVATDPDMEEQEDSLVDVVETMDSVKRRQEAVTLADVHVQQQVKPKQEKSTVAATVTNPGVQAKEEKLAKIAETMAYPGMPGKEEKLAKTAEAMDLVKRSQGALMQADAVANPYVRVQQQTQTKKQTPTAVAAMSHVGMQPTEKTLSNKRNQQARTLEAFPKPDICEQQATQSEQYRNALLPGAVHVGARLSEVTMFAESPGHGIGGHLTEHNDRSSDASDLPPCLEADLVCDSEKGEEGEIVVAEAVQNRSSRKVLILIVIIILIAGNLTLGLVFSRKNRQETSDPFITESDDDSDKFRLISEPILQTVKDRGFIRCKPDELELLENEGFTLDLCRAIAAGIFDDVIDGNTSRIEFIDLPVGEQYAALWNGMIDVSTAIVTHTMVRDVYEPSTGLRMAFSTPFFYAGMIFAGKPTFVDCAERRDSLNGECRSLSVCVVAKTTHAKNLHEILPGVTIHEGAKIVNLSEMFVNNTCNVIASEIFWAKEQFVRDMGYEGEYIYGSRLFSNEPLTMASMGDDQEWADFCNWILQALIAAEALDITQETALSSSLWSDATTGNKFPETTFVFGDEYKNMFRNAIASVGNYGEVYERNFESFAPRSTGIVNNMNYGESGLLYSFPFGDLTISSGSTSIPPPGPMIGGTLESIAGRGVLRCGISGDRPGFALLESSKENVEIRSWAGLDVEYCRAIAAALFPEVIFDQDSVIEFVDVGSNGADGYIALDDDRIDVFVGGSMTLSSDIKETTTGKGFMFSLPYFYYDTNDMMSNEKIGLSLVTRETDTQWSAFVRWISIALIYAEEHDITQEIALDMPILHLFGSQYFQMFRDAVLAVGNYGEMFNRTLEVPYNISRAGRNLINSNSGPLFVPFPFV